MNEHFTTPLKLFHLHSLLHSLMTFSIDRFLPNFAFIRKVISVGKYPRRREIKDQFFRPFIHKSQSTFSIAVTFMIFFPSNLKERVLMRDGADQTVV